MALSVLITQCLQRDFVDLIHPHDPLPNRLHIGPDEAKRLLGPDPSSGSVAHLMTRVRALPPERLEVIHIRDWHDPTDPAQQDHLEMFGEHCIARTKGASLILELEDGLANRPNEQIVNSIGLNDFEATGLEAVLTDLRARAGGEPLRVGVVGVWTEAKVSFLLYDLKTRLGIDALATCSALNASASRAQHFNALEQLSRLLGVQCFDSVGAFVSWLVPEACLALPELPARFGVKPVMVHGDLAEFDQDIVSYLFRDSSQVTLDPLSGGFSGASVYRASSRDTLGHQQAPSVVKLGPRDLIGKERVAFERVEEVLGNNAPSVRGFVDLGGRAGIKYSFAAMGHGKVRTFKSLFEDLGSEVRLVAILEEVFNEILGPLYSAARYERLPLLAHYEFGSQWAAPVRGQVAAIVGDRVTQERLAFPGGYEVPNVCGFYERFLAGGSGPIGDFHFVSYVHGDLNGANILIDGRENVWIIDFFHTAPGHVLKDVAKLENDILYLFTPVETRADLAEALHITRALRAVADLQEPLPETLAGLKSPALLRAWMCVRTLRGIAAKLCRDDRNPVQLAIALLRYAVHSLGFEEASPLQREWALAGACGYAADVEDMTIADESLRIDWVDSADLALPGRIGITICPGRRDRKRDLEADVAALAAAGVSKVLCLLSDAELEWAGAPALGERVRAAGMEFRQSPVPDQRAPGALEAAVLVDWCLEGIQAGGNVVVHCLGGLGRAGTVAACVLRSGGLGPSEAISRVRSGRGPRALETREQERFVTDFEPRRVLP